MTQQLEGWLGRRIEELKDDPAFVAEGMAIAFAEEVCAVLAERGISQAAFARELNVSPAHVSKVLNAAPNLTLRSIAAIALALGLEAKVFIQGHEPQKGLRRREGAGMSTGQIMGLQLLCLLAGIFIGWTLNHNSNNGYHFATEVLAERSQDTRTRLADVERRLVWLESER